MIASWNRRMRRLRFERWLNACFGISVFFSERFFYGRWPWLAFRRQRLMNIDERGWWYAWVRTQINLWPGIAIMHDGPSYRRLHRATREKNLGDLPIPAWNVRLPKDSLVWGKRSTWKLA